MTRDTFFDVPRTSALTSEGRVDLPMFFYHVGVRHLNYWVDYERAQPLLSGTGLMPCRFFNHKALVSMIFFDYRDVSIPAYREVTITIVVRPLALKDPGVYLPVFLRRKGESWGSVGGYVLDMPVTIPEARAAGREIWGYPKFETSIPFRLTGKSFAFEVKDPDRDCPIVTVEGMMGQGLRMSSTDLVTFSNLNDRIVRTIVDVDAQVELCLSRGVRVIAGPSDHGMAVHVRDLGLDTLQPFLIMSSDSMRTRLNQGVAVAPWKTPVLPYPPQKTRVGS